MLSQRWMFKNAKNKDPGENLYLFIILFIIQISPKVFVFCIFKHLSLT